MIRNIEFENYQKTCDLLNVPTKFLYLQTKLDIFMV